MVMFYLGIRKSSEIDDVMYTHQDSVTVKEELAQLNNIWLVEDASRDT